MRFRGIAHLRKRGRMTYLDKSRVAEPMVRHAKTIKTVTEIAAMNLALAR